MSGRLFAFQVARREEASQFEPVSVNYNPQAQVAVWVGSPQAVAALYCTGRNNQSTYYSCNAYGEYCNTWNPGFPIGYRCDRS